MVKKRTNFEKSWQVPAGKGDALTAATLRAALGPRAHYRAEVGSSNDLLRELAAGGAAAGTIVVADYQHRGKGRRERRWQAPAGSSLLFSYLFRPEWPAAQAPWLTMIAGLAAVEAVAALPLEPPLQPALKWPNDLMLPGAEGWAKFGGILLESSVQGERLVQAILGMGLNVNIPAASLPETTTPATSLLLAAGQPLPRLSLLGALIARLEHHFRAAEQGSSPQPAWNEHLLTRGQQVQVHSRGETLSGKALGTDEWGRLLLQTAGGTVRAIAAGDVTLRPPG